MNNVLRNHYPEIFNNQLQVNLHADIEKYVPKEEVEKKVEDNENEKQTEKEELSPYDRAVLRVNADGLFCWRGGGLV